MHALFVLLLFALRLPAVEPAAFWVWHRGDPLRAAEIAELQGQRVPVLFWNVGEMEMRDGAWRWKARAIETKRLGGPLRIVPVVRLGAETKKPFAPVAWAKLGAQLRAVATQDGELQIDFDCPDRLLGAYAAALAELRRAIPRLSITALAHWSTQPAFSALQGSVSEITPMFYRPLYIGARSHSPRGVRRRSRRYRGRETAAPARHQGRPLGLGVERPRRVLHG